MQSSAVASFCLRAAFFECGGSPSLRQACRERSRKAQRRARACLRAEPNLFITPARASLRFALALVSRRGAKAVPPLPRLGFPLWIPSFRGAPSKTR
jgi:hypothetical protein